MGKKSGSSAWRRHDGDGSCPVAQGGQRIQWRVIGTNRCKVTRAGKMDWTLTFEWRFV